MPMLRGCRPARMALAVAALAAVAIAPAVAQESQRSDYDWHMWGGGWPMLFGPLWALLFFAAAIGVAVLLVRWLSGTPAGGAGPSAANTPLDILRERFARGEIDKEEFEERRRILGG